MNIEFASSSIFVLMSKLWLKREPNSLCDVVKSSILTIFTLVILGMSINQWYLIYSGGLDLFKETINSFSVFMQAMALAVLLINVVLIAVGFIILVVAMIVCLGIAVTFVIESSPFQRLLTPFKEKYAKTYAVISALLGKSCVKVSVRR